MTIIKTITQEHLESTLLSITHSYEQAMKAEISRFRDDCVLSDIGKQYSSASKELTRLYNHYSSQVLGIYRLMGFCCDSSEMFESMSSSFSVYATSMLDELSSIFLSRTEYSFADAEIPEKDELDCLDTESSTLAPLTGSASDEQQPATNPPKGHCAYCAAYIFSFPNNPGFGGRPSRYCSDACKMKAYRQRRKAALRKPLHLSKSVTKVLVSAQLTGTTQQATS